MIYSIRDLKSNSVLAIVTQLPKMEFVYHMAEERKRHVSVCQGGLKLFDTKWYLQNMGV